MKLPDDPKERKKLYIAMVLVGGAVLYGVYAGVITPVRNSKARTIESIDELKQQIDKAEQLIGRVERQRSKDDKVVDQIVGTAIQNTDFIVPRLGNYLLSARDVIDAAAERSELGLQACTEVGLSEIPQHAGRKTKNAFRSYTIRVGLSAGIYPLLGFMRELETENPYVCLRAVSVAARPGSPEQHQVTLDVQWPTWASGSVREEFRSIVESRESEEK